MTNTYTNTELETKMTEVKNGRNFLEISYGGSRFTVTVRDCSLDSKGKYNYCETKDFTTVRLSNKKELAEVVEKLMNKYNCEKAYLIDNTTCGYEAVSSYYKVPAKVMKTFNVEVTNRTSYEVMLASILYKDKELWLELVEEYNNRKAA